MKSTESFKLEPGTYVHTFQCSLPYALPTSVVHDTGHIIYGAEIVLDIPVNILLLFRFITIYQHILHLLFALRV